MRKFSNIVGIEGDGTHEACAALALHTDTMAEIQNTRRAATAVKMSLR